MDLNEYRSFKLAGKRSSRSVLTSDLGLGTVVDNTSTKEAGSTIINNQSYLSSGFSQFSSRVFDPKRSIKTTEKLRPNTEVSNDLNEKVRIFFISFSIVNVCAEVYHL